MISDCVKNGAERGLIFASLDCPRFSCASLEKQIQGSGHD